MNSIRKGIFAFLLLILLTSCSRMSEIQLERRIERVEKGLLADLSDPPGKWMNLTDRMEYYKVPGVSIAMINEFQIEWAKGYGLLEAGKNQPVTNKTIFQTASIAKPMVAVVSLHYVETGDLALDGDVNRKLVSWQVPENEYTDQAPVTLRHLLSHSAGMTFEGYRGYAQGEAIPNLQQILDGEQPANSPPVRVNFVPGTRYSYSGGGYMIVEQLLVDVVGQPFDVIMEETVLEPLQMSASTFEYPLPEILAPVAASGHRVDGSVIPGGWHTYPEMGAGGSPWATPSDIARFYVDLMLTYTGQSENIISQEMAVEMLTPQIEDRGLGPWINDEGGDLYYFGHPGGNDGYKTYVLAYPKRGQGLVVMTNSDSGEALIDEIKNSVTIEYGWVRDYTIIYTGIVVLLIVGIVMFLIWHRKRSSRDFA
ncbi:MAG TPA: serine hydrolase domain-containing protein [Anaerolineales bacterium]|nr:serine hydrolase domain-containing protein [Anaerolineales bacterium]